MLLNQRLSLFCCPARQEWFSLVKLYFPGGKGSWVIDYQECGENHISEVQ